MRGNSKQGLAGPELLLLSRRWSLGRVTARVTSLSETLVKQLVKRLLLLGYQVVVNVSKDRD